MAATGSRERKTPKEEEIATLGKFYGEKATDSGAESAARKPTKPTSAPFFQEQTVRFVTRRKPRGKKPQAWASESEGHANTIDTISGGNGEGVPPVPIPNTEVKPFSADGTWLDTARESRSPPDSK